MPNKTYRPQQRRLPAQIARDLRQRSTSAEQVLWEHLRDRKLNGMKFRRQYAIPDTPYVADFYCDTAELVIELDGAVHATQREQDALRQQEIEALSYRVLRLTNEQVFNQLNDVLAVIVSSVGG